jgi:hypothetical protein
MSNYDKGSKRCNARLDEHNVILARWMRRYQKPRPTMRALAKQFGVGYQTMYKALVGITWRHVRF